MSATVRSPGTPGFSRPHRERRAAGSRPLLHELADAYNKMPQAFPEDPVSAFERDLYVHPFHEEDPVGLVHCWAPTTYCSGPTPPCGGHVRPITYVDELEGLPDDELRKVMGGNMFSLMGLTVDA